MSLSVSQTALSNRELELAATAPSSRNSTSTGSQSKNSTSGTDNNSNVSNPTISRAPTRETLSAKLHELVTTGLTNQQIATRLGLSLAQVDISLGVNTSSTSTAQSSTASLESLSARLSVKA